MSLLGGLICTANFPSPPGTGSGPNSPGVNPPGIGSPGGNPIICAAIAELFAPSHLLHIQYLFGAVICQRPPPISPTEPVTPLVVDLDGDGVETGLGTFFDHGGDDFAEYSGWVSEDDGVLAIDLDGNGTIDSGAELFGDHTRVGRLRAQNGFKALEQIDSNSDGVINSSDDDWGKLRVHRWVDGNNNGIFDQGEGQLETLAQHNIASLSLDHDHSTTVDTHGNEHRLVGSYTKTDGSAQDLVDVWFKTAPELSRYVGGDVPAHSETIAGLPNAIGGGFVHELRNAMALDDAGRLVPPFYGTGRTETRTLAQLVAAFGTATDDAAKDVLLEKILHRWAGAEGAQIHDYWGGRYFAFSTPEKLAVVEAFMGTKWRDGEHYRHPTLQTAQKFNRAYYGHSERLRAQLLMQTSLEDMFDAFAIKYDGEPVTSDTDLSTAVASDLTLDFSGVLEVENAASRKGDFLRSLAAFTVGCPRVHAALVSASSEWAYEYQYHSDYLAGMVTDGNTQHEDEFIGNEFANTFRTKDGGIDILRGASGADIYQLGRGTGHDVIEEDYRGNNDGVAATDVVKVAPGFTPSDVTLTRSAQDLVISLLGSNGQITDSLRVKNYYVNDDARIEKIQFEDGTTHNHEDFADVVLGNGDGTHGPDFFDASGLPGVVEESQRGGRGSDTYLLGRGTGHAVIDEAGNFNQAGSGGDAIQLMEGLALSDVRLSRHGAGLKVGLVDSNGVLTDSLTIKGHYCGEANKVERLESSDGTFLLDLSLARTDLRLLNGDAGGIIEGLGGGIIDVFGFDAGSDIFRGKSGNDVYELGLGSGTDYVEEGHQNRPAGDSADTIRLGAGVTSSMVRMRRATQWDLVVELRGAEGVVTDSLTVKDHYRYGWAKVERIVLHDDSVLWSAPDIEALTFPAVYYSQTRNPIRGSSADEDLRGRNNAHDIFESDRGGNDRLYGFQGNDEYRLGRGIGSDEIHEGVRWLNGIMEPRDQADDPGDLIKVTAGYGTGDVRLRRDERHLWVELLGTANNDGARPVTDSLKVIGFFERRAAEVETLEFDDGTVWGSSKLHGAEFRGGSGNDDISGSDDVGDVFDADAGGNDRLFGHLGDDEYRLGRGTGLDEVHEGSLLENGQIIHISGDGDKGDLIKIEEGIGVGDVRWRRDGNHLWVELLGVAGDDGTRAVTDSLKVVDYYDRAAAKVETIELADGTVWGSSKFLALVLHGGPGDDNINGHDDWMDIFDSDAGGNDKLFGGRGDDEYRLGRGTGTDEVHEWSFLQDGQINRIDGKGDYADSIKVDAGIGVGDVRLRRDDKNLWVELLGTAGEDGVRPVTDSLKVVGYYERAAAKVETVEFADGTVWGPAEFHAVVLRGGPGVDNIVGRDDLADIFDSDAGGDDILFGQQGDDEYRLGRGTGADTIREGYRRTGRGTTRISLEEGSGAGDLIRIKAGIGVGDVRLRRDSHSLWVELLGIAGEDGVRPVTDSLKVQDYYNWETSRIETIEFADGTVWGSAKFQALVLRGGPGDDDIRGSHGVDIIDSDAGGNDNLYGGSGDDEYRLGSGTGFDTIHESSGSNREVHETGDLIRIKSGIGVGDVRLRRDRYNLWVELLGAAGENGARPVTDSLKIEGYFRSVSSRVEAVEFSDGTVWGPNELGMMPLRERNSRFGIQGSDLTDVFDADTGGNDYLFGRGGDDEYRLGSGTGFDEVHEYQGGGDGDFIKVKDGFGVDDIRLRRVHSDLLVELLGTANDEGVRPVTDSLKVVYYYFVLGLAAVESIKFGDATVWGGSFVVGTEQGDTVTSTIASETLHGGKGDDTYVFSGEFGDDRVVDSGGSDKIQISGQSSSTLSFSQEGNDMVMEVIGSDDKVTFDNWYAEGGSRKVERIEAGNKVLLSTAAERMATAMASFITGGGTASDFVTRNHQDYWETISGTPGG